MNAQFTPNSKGLFTWREGARVTELRETELPWESQVLLRFFRSHSKAAARQGNPPSQGTLSTCPRHLSMRAIFLPCKRFVARYPG